MRTPAFPLDRKTARASLAIARRFASLDVRGAVAVRCSDVPKLACLTFLLWAGTAGAVAMRGDFYDPGLTNSGKEVRYRNLAVQARFAAVAAITQGAVGYTAKSGHMCTGTLVGEYTLLTAAHCFRYDPDNSKTELHQLGVIYVSFGANISAPDKVLRVKHYTLHPDWIAGGYGTNGLGGDFALVQVYDAATNGPVTGVTPASLYTATDEVTNLSFPVVTGFGLAMYGADVPTGPGGGTPTDSGGVKRAALTRVLGLETQSAANDTLTAKFISPGTIFLEGLPSNFLQGGLTPGDSGGGFFLNDPTDATRWLLAGVNSWTLKPATNPGYDDTWSFRYEQSPLTGGAKSAYGRVSSKVAWIQANMYGPPTPYADQSVEFDAGLLVASTGSPVLVSTPLAVKCDTSPLGIDYVFPGGTGTVDIYLAGEMIGTFSAAGPSPGSASIPMNALPLGCGSTGAGPALVSLSQQLQFEFTGPAGSTVLFDRIDYPTMANGDFAQGLSGWSSALPDSIAVVDRTAIAQNTVFDNGFE